MDSVSSILDTILCEMAILFLYWIDFLRNMYLESYFNLNMLVLLHLVWALYFIILY
jgi:hypothetical protein